MWHATRLTHKHFKKIKNKKKPRSDTWQSLFMVVNDLNNVRKRMTQLNKIDENYNIFEHNTKIRTYLTKLDENLDKKVF